MLHIPVPEVRELPDDEAARVQFCDFGLVGDFDDAPTAPLPLELEPLPRETFAQIARRVLAQKG